jgi:hypothetical protein
MKVRAVADVRLDGAQGEYLATAQEWDFILARAEECGWVPEHPPMLYRADVGLRVTPEDARALGDGLAAYVTGLSDWEPEEFDVMAPAAVLHENLGGLEDVVEFCRAGAFRVC